MKALKQYPRGLEDVWELYCAWLWHHDNVYKGSNQCPHETIEAGLILSCGVCDWNGKTCGGQ